MGDTTAKNSQPIYAVIQEVLSVEDKKATKSRALYYQRQPKWVVLPHLGIRNVLDIRPNRRRFVSFDEIALAIARPEHGDMEFVPVQKLEKQLPHLL